MVIVLQVLIGQFRIVSGTGARIADNFERFDQFIELFFVSASVRVHFGR